MKVEIEPEAGGAIPHHAMKKSLRLFMESYGLFMIFLLMFFVMIVFSESFRNPRNLVNLLQQVSINGVIACGMTLMLISGGIDLSVGATAAMSSMVAAELFLVMGIPFGVGGAILASLLAGFCNGLLIAKAKINAFVTTLGMSYILRGILYVSTNAGPIYAINSGFTKFGLGYTGPLPNITGIFFLVAVITHIVLRYTPYGQHLLSTGGNEEASRLSGINVDRVKIITYSIGGLLAGIGGLIILGQTGIAQPTHATGYELNAIAAAVVGGTPLTGGQGKIINTVLGVLLLGLIQNAQNLLNIQPYWQPVITGAIIVIAVGLDTQGKRS